MSENFIFIVGRLALSNGQYTLQPKDHVWVLSNGVQLVSSSLRRHAILLTGRLVEDAKDPVQMLSALDHGALSAPLDRYHQGSLFLEQLRDRLIKRIEDKARCDRYDAEVAALDARYPQVDQTLKTRVKYFDRYYDYSDDIAVYRAGKASETALYKDLDQTPGGREYAKAFFNLKH